MPRKGSPVWCATAGSRPPSDAPSTEPNPGRFSNPKWGVEQVVTERRAPRFVVSAELGERW
ncbi:hypothetical protein BN381_240009 [Candidatus Microthrix parvicella RN1]|uniref:Uncharacterized protein n=1 Tax=Candidatus Neomicrothrix parvicella RN1 TaxID=1229780 RepID=R4Z4L1_9ACTN|nr:hypothetical protein BN381_240009 [Candidatus Microthrix parvicella RN1]